MPEQRRELSVDGVPVPFTLLASGDVWVAHGEHHGVHITAIVAWTAGLTDADDEDYWTFRMRLLLGGRPLGEDEDWERMQLLGHAHTPQGEDPPTYADFPDGDVEDWAVLLPFSTPPT